MTADPPPDARIRVVLADDQALVRAGFRSLLSYTPDIDVVGEASDGNEAVELVRRLVPDIVLMDIKMPGLDGIESTRRICTDPRLSAVRVIVLTTFQLDEYVFATLRAGASGFLLKDIEPDDLRGAIRIVARGDALLSPAVTRTLIAAFTAGPSRPATAVAQLETLTEREREATALAGQGLDNTSIAARLVISPSTAKTHITRAMAKIGARDRAQLVVFAYQSGLVTPPGP
jgi:DNA-binding NarL/FixJ family response regulator